MEGRALTWYKWWETSTTRFKWEEIRQELLNRFQPVLFNNPFDILLSLKQEGMAKEYRELFETYVGPLNIVKSRYLKGIFLNELKEDVIAEIKLHLVETLNQVMNLADLIDD